jgi:hypothetical protein
LINGLAGFLSNPSRAKKALIFSEVTFGFRGAVGCADGAGNGLGSDGSRVHGISGGSVYLAGSGVDGIFGEAAEVICGDTHHTYARRVADFDRGAGEEPAPGGVKPSRFSEPESRRINHG